ncbi:MAG: type II CAAX endopeptidase family protein [Acidobacteriaceae bacterium]
MRIETKHAIKQFLLGILNLAIAIGLMVAVRILAHGHLSDRALNILAIVIMATAYLGGTRVIEHIHLTEFDDAGGIGEFPSGLILGFCLFSTTMLLLWLLSVYHPTGWEAPSGLGKSALSALSAAIVEEIMFRGFLFRLIARLAGTWWALLVTAALFGAAHAFNPGATLVSSMAIAIEAGVLLGAAYALTQRLWLPIGLHAAWNFTESSVYGMSVSGTGHARGFIAGTLTGPNLLTGGQFGPEASLIAVLVCLSAASFLLWRVIRLHRIQPPLSHQPIPLPSKQ